MAGVEGFIYPNEVELQWSVLMVSVHHRARGGRVHSRVARTRLQCLGGASDLPARAAHGAGVPHRRAAAAADAPRSSRALLRDVHHAASRIGHMAMFGFVYLWYLMGVLVLEIWFDYRKDLVLTWKSSTGLKRQFYGALTLWSDDITPEALRIDDKIGRSSRSSASRRRSCCTATSVSFSDRSRPIRGGRRR